MRILLGACALLVFASCGGAAVAQSLDPVDSYDMRDVLDRLPHDVDDLPTQEEARGRAVIFGASLAGTYSNNAGGTPDDRIDAGYLTPELSLDVTPVDVGGGWSIGGGAALDADYYGDDHDDDLGEGRLEGFVFAERPIGPGTLTTEFVALAIYDNEFSDHDTTLLIGDVTYSLSHEGLSLDFGADYQYSDDVPEARRIRLATELGYTFPSLTFGHEITIEGDLVYSDFTDGANSDRTDTLAALVLTAERTFGGDWTLEWHAAAVNRFSDHDSAEFDAFDVGVEIAKQF